MTMYHPCYYGAGYAPPRSYRTKATQTKFPSVNEVVPPSVLSDMTQICGQTHRSSMDFQVGPTSSGANIWQVNAPDGVTFSIWQDISGGKDTQWYDGLKNGSQIKLNPSSSSGSFTYYVANPQNATAGFNVTLTPVSLTIPPPPPPPSH